VNEIFCLIGTKTSNNKEESKEEKKYINTPTKCDDCKNVLSEKCCKCQKLVCKTCSDSLSLLLCDDCCTQKECSMKK
jgi:hypothetical protein